MALTSRLNLGDVEAAKRNDDHVPGSRSQISSPWTHRGSKMRRSNAKRVLALVLVLVAFYYFFKNMPTDLGPLRQRPSYMRPGEDVPGKGQPSSDISSEEKPPIAPQLSQILQNQDLLYNHDGAVAFDHLLSSLSRVPARGDQDAANTNVLFAASNINSVTNLLPLACEMGRMNHNRVHFAIMGRHDIHLETIQSLNGITPDCALVLHDARPTHASRSTARRMQSSAYKALEVINRHLHPRAVLIDRSDIEDDFFLKGTIQASDSLDRTLITLPTDYEKELRWIAKLDSVALSAWNDVQIDILVHVEESQLSSLAYLLKSLKNADMFGSPAPRLTIDIPAGVDASALKFLEAFTWPPKRSRLDANLLFVRRRLSSESQDATYDAAHFMELVNSVRPQLQHVLILSPTVEVSPLFYHYLKYLTLLYQYSAGNAILGSKIFGVSLTPPTALDTLVKPEIVNEDVNFLWQAPNADAMLIFGDRWAELQDLVTRTIDVPKDNVVDRSWLAHATELIKLRGLTNIYHNLEEDLAIVRGMSAEGNRAGQDSKSASLMTSAFEESMGPAKPLHQLDSLGFNGQRADLEALQAEGSKYRAAFRKKMGCEGRNAVVDPHSLVGDIFCVNRIARTRSKNEVL